MRLLILLVACSAQVDPCAGIAGPCVGVHLDSQVKPLEQILITLDGNQTQKTPMAPAQLSLPVRFAVKLPPTETAPRLDFAGLQNGSAVATAGAQPRFDASGHAEVSLTLLGTTPGIMDLASSDSRSSDLASDFSVAVDLAGAHDLAGADLAGTDLAGADLTAPIDDLAGVSTDMSLSYPLTITYGGTGTGTVTIDGTTSCPPPGCTVQRPAGARVGLHSTVNGTNSLVAYTGACSSISSDCTFAIAAASAVTVNFQDSAKAMLRIVPVLIGSGTGTVTAVPTSGFATSCGTNCYIFDAGAQVTLAQTTTGTFLGWGGVSPACAPTSAPCLVTMSQNLAVTASFSDLPMNYAFVTNTQYTGSTLGSSFATVDQYCKDAATAANLPNPSFYKAWVSIGPTTAKAHVETNASGWVRLDGLPVGGTAASLVDPGRPLYPIDIDETLAQNLTTVWTGTNADGTGAANCSNWASTGTGLVGNSGSGGFPWTALSSQACMSFASLYCFGYTNNNPLVLQPTSGARKAFLSTASWSPSLGSDDADMLCTSEAQSASLGGSWRAYLNRDFENGLSIFDLTGGPWERLDHVLLAPLASATRLESFGAQRFAPLVQMASGSYLSNPVKAWVGSSGNNCSDWNVGTSSFVGDYIHGDRLGESTTSQTCDSPATSLFCLQR